MNEDEPARYNVCCACSGNAKFSNAMRVGVLMRSWSSGGDVRVAARLKSASVPILPLGIEHCIRKLRISTNGLQTLYLAGSGYWQKNKNPCFLSGEPQEIGFADREWGFLYM